MVVAICGSSGLIGTAVKQALEARDCRIVPVTRTDIASGSDHLKDLLDGCDALVNLAGVSIAGRWTEARKKEIYESRVLTTRRLVEAVNSLEKPLADFITASAVGIYDSVEVHDEFSTSYASGFLADLCIDWEHEALKVDAENTRLTNPCSRMDINTSFRMCHLSDNPGQQGNFQLIQRMCYSVIGNSPDRWIAEDHFFPALCSRIAKEGCFYICCKYLTNLRKLLDKLHTEFCSPGLCLV
jgi:hypothetical protein